MTRTPPPSHPWRARASFGSCYVGNTHTHLSNEVIYSPDKLDTGLIWFNSLASASTLSISSDSNGSTEGSFSGLLDGLLAATSEKEFFFSLDYTKTKNQKQKKTFFFASLCDKSGTFCKEIHSPGGSCLIVSTFTSQLFWLCCCVGFES